MMLKLFLFTPYVALACSFLLAAVVSMICFSRAEASLEARGFTLRAGTTPTKARLRTASSSPSGKRALQKAAA